MLKRSKVWYRAMGEKIMRNWESLFLVFYVEVEKKRLEWILVYMKEEVHLGLMTSDLQWWPLNGRLM